jgi:Tfp pilus assembly protein PilN
MRAVNLLPRDLGQPRSEGGRAPLFVAAGGLAAVTAGSVVVFLAASGSVADQRARLDTVEAAISRIPKREAPAVAPRAIAQERVARTAALSAALATRVPVDRLLRELAYVLPKDAWLVELAATAPSSTTTVGATSTTAEQGVSIVGATYSYLSVARVLSRLAAAPTLDDVRLTGTARVLARPGVDAETEPNAKTIITFTIGANLRVGSSA